MTDVTTHPGRHDQPTHPAGMPDERAQEVLEAVMHLAVVLRDDPSEVARAAASVLELAGDPVAALCVAAALVDVDGPVDAWWQSGLDGVRSGEPVVPLVMVRAAEVPRLPSGPRGVEEHGSHRGYNQHQARGEDACDDCLAGERLYSRNRKRVTRPVSTRVAVSA